MEIVLLIKRRLSTFPSWTPLPNPRWSYSRTPQHRRVWPLLPFPAIRLLHACNPPGEAARVAESFLAAFLVYLGVPCALAVVRPWCHSLRAAWRGWNPC